MRGWWVAALAPADARREGRQVVVLLQGIAGRHQQPDGIEPQPLQRFERHQPVPGMGRIEAAAEQADAHAGGGKGQGGEALRQRGGGRRHEAATGEPSVTGAPVRRPRSDI